MDQTQSLFTTANNDWGVNFINSISASGTTVSALIGAYNVPFTVIAGFMMIYLLLRSIYETAHHGKVMGKANTLWFAPRIVITLGLITPLPPNMYNMAENIILWAAQGGLANGSNVWAAAVQSAAQMQPMTSAPPPQVGALAENLFNLEFCMAVQNATNGNSNSALITESNPPAYDGPGRMVISYDGDPNAGGVSGQCGQIIFAKANNTQTTNAQQQTGSVPPVSVDAIYTAQVTATRAMQTQIQSLAQSLVPKFLPPYSDVSVSMIDVSSLEQSYTSTVSSAASSLISSQNSDLSAFQAAATNGGMVKAGAWAINLMTVNDTVQDAVSAVPTVSPPRYTWWNRDAYKEQRAAMVSAKIWWEEHFATPQANTSNAAYSATSEKSTGEMSRIEGFIGPNTVRDLFNAQLTSCGTNFFNPTTASSTSGSCNPFAAMSSLGIGLIDHAWDAVGLAATAAAVAAAGRETAQEETTAATATPIVGSGIGAATAIVAGAAEFLETFISFLKPMIWFLIFEMLAAGIMLAYILPLTPALIWYFAIARYLMLVTSSTMGSPLWAISHLELEGEGLGQKSTPGWLIILSLLARPSMMVVALVMGLATYGAMGQLFSIVYFEMVMNSTVGGAAGITGLLTYTVVGGAMIVALCAVCMSGVTEGVDTAMRLVGEHLHRSGDAVGDAQNVGQKSNLGGDVKQGLISGRSENAARSREENQQEKRNATSADRRGDDDDHLANY